MTKMTKLFCTNCFKEVISHFTEREGWFNSYHCTKCKNEIARGNNKGFSIWNGYEFKSKEKPSNIEIIELHVKINGVKL